MPKSIYFTDEAYQQITEAARQCGFRVSRGRGSQLALFVVAAANKACTLTGGESRRCWGCGTIDDTHEVECPNNPAAGKA